MDALYSPFHSFDFPLQRNILSLCFEEYLGALLMILTH